MLAQGAPQRIATTAPSEAEALFAMGLGPRVVGVSQYAEWPPEVKRLPKTGSYMQSDAETILRLKPDLVLLERGNDQLGGRLDALGLRHVEVPNGGLAETFAGLEVMAKAAGAPERGDLLAKKLRAGLEQVRDAARRSARVRVLIVVDRRPGLLADMIAAGRGGYVNELLEAAGGDNVLARPGVPPYPRISLETILRENPDVLIDLTDTHDTDAAHIRARAEDKLLWEREASLSAVRQHRVFIADSSAFVVPGPRMVEAAQKLFGYLHGQTP